VSSAVKTDECRKVTVEPDFLNISAVMVTGKTPAHEKWARVAMRCFMEQSYRAEHRELLIINDGGYQLVNGDAPQDATGRPLIREVRLPQVHHTVGMLRNVGLEEAWGDCVIQWDDDDWHGPDRMALQARRLIDDPGKACAFLKRQVRYSFPTNSAKVYSSIRIHGTIMHRRCEIRYSDTQRGEDTIFMRRFITRYGRRSVADIPQSGLDCDRYYIRFHHGRNENSWNLLHIMGLSAGLPGVWRLPRSSTTRLARVLREYYGFEVRPGFVPSTEKEAKAEVEAENEVIT
jgi:sulfur relay (sulfurtransferase) DsrF/TusC family protein